MIGVKVLNDDKCRPANHRDGAKEQFQGFQPPRRRADANDRRRTLRCEIGFVYRCDWGVDWLYGSSGRFGAEGFGHFFPPLDFEMLEG